MFLNGWQLLNADRPLAQLRACIGFLLAERHRADGRYGAGILASEWSTNSPLSTLLTIKLWSRFRLDPKDYGCPFEC